MIRLISFLLLVAFPHAAPAQAQGEWKASGKEGAVAAGGQGAVDAGIAMLKRGGNAADAAAATILALSVTDSRSFCFGGEVPIIVWNAKRGCAEVLVGLGAAPRLATQEHFAKTGIPGKGIEPAPVPGAFDAVLTLLERHGTLRFADAVGPTLKLLENGRQPWHADLTRTLHRLVAAEKEAGSDRIRGLRRVSDYFYRGPIAREIDEWSKANGGLIRYSDLATHVTRVEEPLTADYRGYTVLKCGVWTQGPCLLQTLRLVEPYDLKKFGHNSPDAIHASVEAMKLALADRDQYYADPNFAEVPIRDLLSDSYTKLRGSLIDMKHASLDRRPGDPRGGKELLEKPDLRTGLGDVGKDTTTCVVADAAGNVVAATPSGFDGVVAGKTGVFLSTRLQSFNMWAGHVNCIEPGKRPRITLTPTIVVKDGKPVVAVSVAGGDGQDQATLQLLLNAIDFGFPPEKAVTAARWQTDHLLGSFRQTPPKLGSLTFFPDPGMSMLNELRARGHKVELSRRPQTAPVLLRIDPRTKTIEVAGDPQARRHAAAY
ncbi:MAG TPA: gamma-glutamyltransferase [Gemmata sp.]|nr:gamma-glutamyltransferase [Gemmata sp.]